MDESGSNAAGVLFTIVWQETNNGNVMPENNWASGVSSNVALSSQHLSTFVQMYEKYMSCVDSSYALLDEKKRKEKAHELLCAFLHAVEASEKDGVTSCTISWQACARAYQMSVDTMYAVASYVATASPQNIVCIPNLAFPSTINAQDGQEDAIVAWLNSDDAHFYNKQNKRASSHHGVPRVAVLYLESRYSTSSRGTFVPRVGFS